MFHVTIFGLKLKFSQIAFTIPFIDWDVYWYGILIATGFFLAIVYGMKNAKRFGVDPDRMTDVILVSAPISVLCARAYYVLFDGEKLESIKDFFGFGSSGFSGIAIYGAVIGAFACGTVMCKIKKIKVLDMADLAVLGFLIGQGIGRWGNFMNQEAYGTFTGSDWWGMTSNKIAKEMGSEALVHPCFLYESLWCIAGFFLIHYLSKKRRFSGEVTLMYCVWYGFERAIIENFRTDSLMIGNSIRVSVLVSVVLCLGAAITLAVVYSKRRAAVKELDYSEMFDYDTDDQPVEEVVLEEDTNE